MKGFKAVDLGAVVSIYLITLMTVIGELYKPFKGVLASLTGHHWVSKGVIAIVVFLLLSFLLPAKNQASGKGILQATLLSSFMIFLFFIWHYQH